MPRTFLPLEDIRLGSISELKDTTPRNSHVVILEGESSPADGGSNFYWWDPSGDPANADGVSIVASNVESTGVWRRIVTPNPSTSDEISEGSSNLFYTDERAQDAINALLQEGNGVTLTYDDASNSLTISASDLTTEEVQDDAWNVLGGTQSLITVTYDDGNDQVDFEVEPNLSNYTNDPGYITDLSSFNTDDLDEGLSNLYYTDERVDDRVSTLVTDGTHVTTTYDDGANTLTFDVDDNLSDYTNDVGYITDLTSFTTDDLVEGSTNLYYTDERVDDRVNALLQEGNGVTLTYDDAADTLTISASDLTTEEVQDDAWDVLTGAQTLINVTYDDVNDEVDFVVESDLSSYSFSNVTTDDIAEGSTNLYYTDERVDDRVDALLQEGNGVTLTYDDAANTLTISASDLTTEEVQDDAWDVLTGAQTLINVTYDDVNDEVDFAVESNLSNYTNDAGFITDLSSFTTDDLVEGSTNLYYTDERVDDRVDQLLTEGSNITLTYDDAANTLTIDATDTQLSDEEVQDAVYNNVLSGVQTLISVSYDDANNEVDYEVESNLSNYTNDVGFITDLTSFTTDDLVEGSSNLYYTDARVNNQVRTISPTDQIAFDGGTDQYAIPHGLGEIPKSWHVTPVTSDASDFSHVDADATNLIVNYSSNTPGGSQNVVLNWTANKAV